MTTDTAMEKKGSTEVSVREHTRNGVHYQPNVDIRENAEELVVLADMPGVRGEDVDIRFENSVLTIHGSVRQRQGEDQRHLLQEYGIGDFHRTFEVGESIDAGEIHAEMENGVLILHLPKVEAVKPRKIEVKTK